MLTDVAPADHPLKIQCNAGTMTVNDTAQLGSYPQTVWHNKNGVANILSMHNASKHYRLTMDTDVENAISLHKADGTIMKFTPSHKGLYKCDMGNSDNSDWNLISTVAEQAQRYTKRAYKKAKAARKMQNIVMRPGHRELMDVTIKHLNDCPVSRADILAAEDIFGSNVGSLKGKTPRKSTAHVHGSTDGVPHDIMRIHQRITLTVDIMFVNTIPFLVTMSRNMHFGTVEALPNRQTSTIKSKLQSVFQLYQHRGFIIDALLADGEFEAIRPWFPMLNCCAADEHIPDVERYIRTIKDRARSTYRMLPFRHLPRLMIVHLIKNAVFWLNSFPHRDGISNEHSPRYFLTGFELKYKQPTRTPGIWGVRADS